MTAQIIQLSDFRSPPRPIEKICSNCDHFWMNRVGHAFCDVFDMPIIDEAADDCEAFENDSFASEEAE